MATNKKPVPLLVRVKETTPPSVRTGGRLISEVGTVSTLSDDDLFVVERAADGMAYRKKYSEIQTQVIASTDYGLLYTTDGQGQSPLVQQTVNATPALYTGWTANGLSSGLTVDHTTDKIVATQAGTYNVNISICFSGTNSKTYEVEIYHDDISASPTPTATGFKLTRKLGTGGDVGSASLTGMVSLEVGDGVMIYVSSTDGGTAFNTHQAQMQVSQV